MINYKCKDFELNEIEDSTNTETTKLFKVSASEINSLNLLKKLQSGSQLYFDIHSVIAAFWGDGDYIINPYLDIDARDNSVMIAVKRYPLSNQVIAGIKRSVKFPMDVDGKHFKQTRDILFTYLSCEDIKISLVKSKKELTSEFVFITCDKVKNKAKIPDCLRLLSLFLSNDMEECVLNRVDITNLLGIHANLINFYNSDGYVERYVPIYLEYDPYKKTICMVFRNKFTQVNSFLKIDADFSLCELKREFSKEEDGSILLSQSFNIMSLAPEKDYTSLDDDHLLTIITNKMKHLLLCESSIIKLMPIFYKIESKQYNAGAIDIVFRFYPVVLVNNKRDASSVIRRMRKGELSMSEESLFVRENKSGVAKIYYSYTDPKSRICIISTADNGISMNNIRLFQNLLMPEFVDDLKLEKVIPYIIYGGDIFLNIDVRGKSAYIKKVAELITKEAERLEKERNSNQ